MEGKGLSRKGNHVCDGHKCVSLTQGATGTAGQREQGGAW